MRIALIGYGGIGKAFLQLINDKKDYLKSQNIDIHVIYVINSTGGVYDPSGINCLRLINFTKTGGKLSDYIQGGSKDIRFSKIIENNDIDLVVEMTPTNKETGEPGLTHIEESLRNGKHVITANKGPVLLEYKRLSELAAKNNVQFGVGCTTGGALPAVNAGLIDMAGSNILAIEGVLNGTTNYILNEMEENESSYSEALKKAQKLGIAETNPSLDVEGWDTATKLLILTNILMNQDKKLSDVVVEGITMLTIDDIKKASEEGKKYKLVGRAMNKDGMLEIVVRPEKLSKDHPLYNVDGKNKGIRYVSDTLGDLIITGGASGTIPAAASILRDLINIHRGYRYSV